MQALTESGSIMDIKIAQKCVTKQFFLFYETIQ